MIYRYTDILEEILIPFLNENSGIRPIFQQDNATSHVSRHTLKWFTERNIAVMKFPPCSPDLNPIENLWAELSRLIYSGNRIFGSREEIIRAIKDACVEIGKNKKEYLLTLHQSVLRRCMYILEHKGAETNL